MYNRVVEPTQVYLPTFTEIKAEDLPPFGKKRGRFLCSTNIAIFDLPVTQN